MLWARPPGRASPPAAAPRRKRRTNQALLVALMEMGIPKHKAEVALEETGNVRSRLY
jgi:hypothetical protein